MQHLNGDKDKKRKQGQQQTLPQRTENKDSNKRCHRRNRKQGQQQTIPERRENEDRKGEKRKQNKNNATWVKEDFGKQGQQQLNATTKKRKQGQQQTLLWGIENKDSNKHYRKKV